MVSKSLEDEVAYTAEDLERPSPEVSGKRCLKISQNHKSVQMRMDWNRKTGRHFGHYILLSWS